MCGQSERFFYNIQNWPLCSHRNVEMTIAHSKKKLDQHWELLKSHLRKVLYVRMQPSGLLYQ